VKNKGSVPHINKRSNGTFLLDRIMINIPLGTNITIKVPSYGFSLTIYHIAQVLHFFVDASFEKKLTFTTDLPNTKKYFSRIAVFE
jgi:hypothetical protein